jgi:type VI secretion system secreted protein Hcp
MAVDIFLKIDGIKGESLDSKHKDEIEVLSYSFGENQTGTFSAGAGGGAGKVSMQDFHFTMSVNKSSPNLFLACAAGQHIKEGLLTVRKAGGDQQEYLKIKLTDILVSSYQTGASHGSEVPLDQVSLNFTKIEHSYAPQNAKGQLEAALTAGWNLKENKKV